MRLTAEQQERYETDGFLAIDRLIDDATVADADEENGCMHLVPGFPTRPLLPQAVACPLRAGGATMHGYGTPHHTPPNRSADRSRRAYIFNFTCKTGLAGILAARKN